MLPAQHQAKTGLSQFSQYVFFQRSTTQPQQQRRRRPLAVAPFGYLRESESPASLGVMALTSM
jgi:hypothetical protein